MSIDISALTPAVLSAADATIARTNRLFIDNVYVEAEGGEKIQVISPIDGKPFTTIAHASAKDVDRAVCSARACFDKAGWPQQDAASRSAILVKIAAALRAPEKLAELAAIESRDCGKTFEEAVGDLNFCADVFDFYADLAPKHLVPEELSLPESDAKDFNARIERQPLGVVGCITPWNYPLMQAALKIAPALASGCTLVLKPSPWASLTCCAFGEIVAAAGAPPGAFNVVTGGPPDQMAESSTGQTLIDHEKLDKVSFTGSGVAGKKMLEASAKRLRPTGLELGGKSAFVVFEDAVEYLDAVVDWVMVGIFPCTGQVCSATSRLIVHSDLEAELTSRLVAAASKIQVGDPLAKGTLMGPVISSVQHQKIVKAIEDAVAAGAVAHKAKLDLPENLSGGFFVPPTILTGLSTEARAWRDEIFGPVLAVRSFKTEEEAVAMANETHYGLANAVYSADPARRRRVASQLKSGVVWENCSQPLFPSTPFGGLPGKASGFGHELGVAGLMEYVSAKTVVGTNSPGFSWGSYSSTTA